MGRKPSQVSNGSEQDFGVHIAIQWVSLGSEIMFTKKIALWVCLLISSGAGILGFIGGFLSTEAAREFFVDAFATEQRADVKNPEEIETSLYTLSYPGNWSLDQSDPNLDFENYLSIDTPGGSYLTMSFAHYETSAEEATNDDIEATIGEMRNVEVSTFDRYGKYQGFGKVVKGHIFGLLTEVRVFSTTFEEFTVTIFEQTYEEDLKMVKPGFQLVERTLSFKQPKKKEPGESGSGDEAS